MKTQSFCSVLTLKTKRKCSTKWTHFRTQRFRVQRTTFCFLQLSLPFLMNAFQQPIQGLTHLFVSFIWCCQCSCPAATCWVWFVRISLFIADAFNRIKTRAPQYITSVFTVIAMSSCAIHTSRKYCHIALWIQLQHIKLHSVWRHYFIFFFWFYGGWLISVLLPPLCWYVVDSLADQTFIVNITALVFLELVERVSVEKCTLQYALFLVYYWCLLCSVQC